MPGSIMHKKLRSATIIETVVALLILMISFSAGMVIYNKVIGAGINAEGLRAASSAEFIADSLLMTGAREDQVLSEREGHLFEVKYTADPLRPGLMIMRVICRDSSRVLAENTRLINAHEKD